jgi:hypothetical protein
MILMIVLASWIVALAVVGGLCLSALRGDTALERPPSEASRMAALDGPRPRTAGDRRPSSLAHREPEHEQARVGQIAVG